MAEVTQGQVVAIDGKTVRRSHDRTLGKQAIHMVYVWASANGLVLGQAKVEEKSNEITAIPKLLRWNWPVASSSSTPWAARRRSHNRSSKPRLTTCWRCGKEEPRPAVRRCP